MKEIALPGVYERISITNTIHESPGIRVRAFLFLNDLENAVEMTLPLNMEYESLIKKILTNSNND